MAAAGLLDHLRGRPIATVSEPGGPSDQCGQAAWKMAGRGAARGHDHSVVFRQSDVASPLCTGSLSCQALQISDPESTSGQSLDEVIWSRGVSCSSELAAMSTAQRG